VPEFDAFGALELLAHPVRLDVEPPLAHIAVEFVNVPGHDRDRIVRWILREELRRRRLGQSS
jgi:hypothetical protein